MKLVDTLRSAFERGPEVTTVGDAMRGKERYIFTLRVGHWDRQHAFDEPVEMREVRVVADEPHEHTLADEIRGGRHEFDDGCVFDVRVARWDFGAG